MIEFYSGSNYEGLVNFSTAVADAPFASELLSTLEAKYENIDDAVDDILDAYVANGYDVTEADVLGLLTEEFPASEEDLQVLSGLYIDEDGPDEVGFERLVNAAIASQELFLGDEDGEYEEDEYDYEDYEDDLEDLYEDDIEDEYDLDEDYDEDYDDDYDEGIAEDFSAAYSRVMEFSYRQELEGHLNDLINYGASLVEEGKLAPIAFQMMFGQDDANRVVNFSRASEASGIDDHTHLNSIRYALNLFDTISELSTQAGYRPLANFSSLSLEDIAPSKDDAVDTLAEGMFNLYRQQNPLR